MDFGFAVISIFAVAFLSNVFPFLGASYALYATLQLTELGISPANFVVVVWSSAVGATLAKVAIYYGAFGLRRHLAGNKNVQLIGRNSGRGSFFAVLFVAAVLPFLPIDDYIFIGAGATKAPILSLSSVALLAKFFKSAFEVVAILAIIKEVGALFHFQSLEATLLLAVGFVLLGVIFYSVDWQGLYKRVPGRAEVHAAGGSDLRESPEEAPSRQTI